MSLRVYEFSITFFAIILGSRWTLLNTFATISISVATATSVTGWFSFWIMGDVELH